MSLPLLYRAALKGTFGRQIQFSRGSGKSCRNSIRFSDIQGLKGDLLLSQPENGQIGMEVKHLCDGARCSL